MLCTLDPPTFARDGSPCQLPSSFSLAASGFPRRILLSLSPAALSFRGRIFLSLTLAALLFTACGENGASHPSPAPPAPADCGATPEAAYESLFEDAFAPACPAGRTGSGSMGEWQADERGLPAYRYTINQLEDPRAQYFTSWGTSTDHWHQVGNEAVTATAHNSGWVEFWESRRGGKCLNRYQPGMENFAGGFRFVKADGEVWNTLYDPDAFTTYERLFGEGYFRKETSRNGIRVVERTWAPFGSDPFLISETEVRNETDSPREVIVYEYWDFNLYELLFAPIMTAPLGELFEAYRWAFNRNFEITTDYDTAENTLTAALSLAPGVSAPPREAVSLPDYYPYPAFLASLNGTPDYCYTDQDRFFGEGGIDSPGAVVREEPSYLLPPQSPTIGKACLVFGKRFELGPGEAASVAYAYGSWAAALSSTLGEYRGRTEEKFQETAAAWVADRADLCVPGPDAAWLRRETLWHSYYLPAGAFYEDYFEGPIVNQGSAYGYIHGLNGAHRDFSLFAMPLVYTRPELARSVISYSLRSQDAVTGEMPYAHMGNGFASGFLLYDECTDLDLFLLMSAAEYLGATGDWGWLDEVLPYYPVSSGRSGPVREHLETALDHLVEYVGTGPNGLIRAGTGDWNDVLLSFSPNPILTSILGESTLNTGMACFLFPRLAELFAARMPEFSARLAALGENWCGLLEGEWVDGQGWMRRGSLGNGSYLGEDKLFLDTQPWPLLAGLWDEGQAAALLGNIEEMLVEPSPAGALCLYPSYPPPLVPGSDTNGGTWAAVDSWLAWAWSLYDPQKAWQFFLKSTLRRHADAYPDVWYGIWSGPDSYNAFYADRPGETFNWSFTPMTDFPVMNMNRHSGPLLDAIRLAGIDPLGDRITISPRVPFQRLSLRLPLIGFAYLADRHRGFYKPIAAGDFRFRVRLPAELSGGAGGHWRFFLNGAPAEAVPAGEHLEFDAAGGPGDTIRWEILPDG